MNHTKLSPPPRNSRKLGQVVKSRWALVVALGVLGTPHHASAAVVELAQPENYGALMGGLGLLIFTHLFRNRRPY